MDDIKYLYNIKRFVLNEPQQIGLCDAIFNWTKNNDKMLFTDEVTNPMTDIYLNPNYQHYYINNFNDLRLCESFLAVTHNNLCTPINRSMDYTKRYNFLRIISKFFNNTSVLPEGIWILEYVRVPKNTLQANNNAYKYMANKILSDDDIENKIIDLSGVSKTLDDILTPFKYKTKTLIPTMDIRVVYFIPKETLVAHDKLFLPKLNIMIVNGNKVEYVRHPNSTEDVNINNVELHDVHTITYDIVKHNITNEEYFVKSGKDILKIIPKKMLNKEEGVYKKVIINGTVVQNEYSTLEDMSNKFGIYPSEELCKYNGDLNLKFSELKFKNEKELLDIKLNTSKLEYSKRILEHNLAIKKHYTDTNIKIWSAVALGVVTILAKIKI